MERWLQKYQRDHVDVRYLPGEEVLPGLKKYTNRYGWRDYYIGKHMLFSHRLTVYDMSVFPEKLHSHDFFELEVYENGNISYVADNHELLPTKGDVILFPPGLLHTARQSEKSEYERFVFYFDCEAFDTFSGDGLPALFRDEHVNCLSVEPAQRCEFFFLLEKIEYILNQDIPETSLLALSYIIQLFFLIGRHTTVNKSGFAKLPQNVLKVKSYIDDNFRDIGTTTEIADYFFYSREYISRMFKQYFNTNISEYLISKKIDCAKRVLEEGRSVTQAFNESGYHSMSSFVNAFRVRTAMTPSEYRHQHYSGNRSAGRK